MGSCLRPASFLEPPFVQLIEDEDGGSHLFYKSSQQLIEELDEDFEDGDDH